MFADPVANRLNEELNKYNWRHGWVWVGDGPQPGSQASRHLNDMNNLSGHVAGHNQEAANAIERAQTSASQQNFTMARAHMDNAAFLLQMSRHYDDASAVSSMRHQMDDLKDSEQVVRSRGQAAPIPGAREGAPESLGDFEERARDDGHTPPLPHTSSEVGRSASIRDFMASASMPPLSFYGKHYYADPVAQRLYDEET
jgi:hypothetical protein